MGAVDVTIPLMRCFSDLEDARNASKRRHKLNDMIAIAIAAVICGANEWTSIAAFGRAKEEWLRQFLELENGIPSHDTFCRVFSLLSPQAFEECFRAWIDLIRTSVADEIIAIDGKSLCRSHARKDGVSPLHMVSAWASVNRVVLGQVATEEKSIEITAIPEILDRLMLKGASSPSTRWAVKRKSPSKSLKAAVTTS